MLHSVGQAYDQRLYQVFDIGVDQYVQDTLRTVYPVRGHAVSVAPTYCVTDLVVVGDSRLAIQHSLGVIACLKESLLTQRNIHREFVARFQSVRYLHITREYKASADSLAGEALAVKEAKTTLTEKSKSKLEQLNRIHEVIYERPNREVTQVSTLRTLSEDMVTQRGNVFDIALKPSVTGGPEPPDRPNDATTESSHVENGEIPPGVAEHPPSAEDIDPLEVLEERRRRVGRAQDEELRWANLKLVLKGEGASLGYKAAREDWTMADRFVLSDDGLLYFLGEHRRWGKDRMNDTILRLVVPTTMVQEVLQSSHDSLEGGHQRIVRTFHRVKADYYWIGLYADAERHVRSCPDCCSRFGRQSYALAWRREVNRQQEIALKMAKEYQAVEKVRRASQHNDSLSRQEKPSLPRPRVSENSEDNPEDAEDTSTPMGWMMVRSLSLSLAIECGCTWKESNQVSLRNWHIVGMDPSELKGRLREIYAYELELPDRNGYRFYPIFHVSRLKAVKEFGDRPKVRLTRELTDEVRLDFDEELLPEDSWEPDVLAGNYEVESILDDRRPIETSTRRSVREFLAKWVGYDEPAWEPMTNLSCGGLLYDYLREKRSS
ncbi:unnamed protein product [Phytophthora fragariaefolia]|uniref:Unnamed protein product n=1 Tax=Phytophthora fragariaefolia TaxID=1490495 RepID=A0A9W7CPM6_9STRA|nr:unnamed protein product [Phytophthora fragariaefolia]